MDISGYIKPTSLYLKATDVLQNPNAVFVIVTEATLVAKDYKGQKSEKLHVEGEFAGKQYIMELGKTNARIVEKLLGSDTQKWIGKALVLGTYKQMTSDGKLVDAILVKSLK